MTTQYFDVVSGSNANSGLSELLPKQHADTDSNGTGATMSAGQIALFKRGQNHPIASNFVFRSNMRWADYGAGAKPKLQKTSATGRLLVMADSVDVSGVVLENFDVDANAQITSASVVEGWAFGAFTMSNLRLSNMEIYGSPDHAGLGLNTDGTGLVTNVKIDSCIMRDNFNHGSISGGNSSFHLYTSCKAYRNGFGTGAHGFSSFGYSAGVPSNGIVWKLCEASGTVAFGGVEGNGFQFDNFCVNSAILSCISHDNQGSGFVSNANAGGNRISGSIAYNNNACGIIAITSPNLVAVNNVLDRNCRVPSASVYAEISLTSTSTGAKLFNNILYGDGVVTKGIDADAGSTGATVTTNCIYNFSTYAAGGAGVPTVSGTITTNPLFVNASARNYRLQATSPCIAAGTWPGSKIVTQDGFIMNGPYDIGAYWSAQARISATASGFLPSDLSGLAAWFRFNQGITASGGAVSQWSDASGNARHLKQVDGAHQPALQGDGSILLDSTSDNLKCDNFTLNQPETVYLLMKQVTWTNSNNTFCDGTGNNMRLFQNGLTPSFEQYAGGGQVNANTAATLNTYCVIGAVFNAASSVTFVNDTTVGPANCGAANAGGFDLGEYGGGGNYSNIQVKEVALYAAAHDAPTRAQVIAYLQTL